MNSKMNSQLDYIYFFSGKKAFRSLSNFWENEVVIDDRIYQSGEHAFHGEKLFRLGHTKYANKFTKPSSYTPHMAKQKGGENGLRLNDQELAQWANISIDVQKEICKYKLRYEEVKEDLINSKGKLLIHQALSCRNTENCIWEGRYVDGNVVGKNLLGNIWMELRDNLFYTVES